jgi:hypothetical protein
LRESNNSSWSLAQKNAASQLRHLGRKQQDTGLGRFLKARIVENNCRGLRQLRHCIGRTFREAWGDNP